jgi:WD40 repeat protein
MLSRGTCSRAVAVASQDIYSVDCITFHPTFGTFATTGSDGTFNFWDKDSRQRLKAFGKVVAFACVLPRPGWHTLPNWTRVAFSPQGPSTQV